MIRRIFLDLDGVIIDWCGAAKLWYGLEFDDLDNTSYKFIEEQALLQRGLSRKVFWEGLTGAFWLNLKKYPWADTMLEFLKPYDPIILTAPTLNNGGWRQQWIRENMGTFFNDKKYIISPAKWACAYPGALLIDDKQSNCTSFIEHGGGAMLFSQPWNTPTFRAMQTALGPDASFDNFMYRLLYMKEAKML